MLAEREGFEPSLGFTLNTLSRRAPSATQPPLRNAFGIIVKSRASLFTLRKLGK